MKSFIKTGKSLNQLIALSLALLLCSHATASEKEQQIISHALKAYGGDKLLSLDNIRYTDTINHFFKHQSGHSLQGGFSQHLNQIQLEVTLDFENKQAELKRLSKLVVGYHDSKNVTATHRIYKDGKGINVDHFRQEYKESDNINPNNTDLSYSQMLDPIIIKHLVNDMTSAQWVDTAFIAGKAHDVLTVNANQRDEYSVYINKTSGLLSRMLQKRGESIRTYDFLHHQTSEGITWAKQLYVSTEQAPLYYSNNRQVSVNIENTKSIVIPKGYTHAAPVTPIDVSRQTIRNLADGVYYVGQDWGYTLFVDLGDHYISAGAWAMSEHSDDWQNALTLLHKTTGNDKPVKLHLVSHHHTDHMSGLRAVVEHGAKFLIHPSDIQATKAFLHDHNLEDNQFVTITDNTYLANGKVMIFDVPNSHASHNLALYLPQEKIVFSEDIFGSSYQKQHHSPRSWPHMDTYQRLSGFVNKINALGLEVEQYLSSHHFRILNQKDIDKALQVNLPSYEILMNRLAFTTL